MPIATTPLATTVALHEAVQKLARYQQQELDALITFFDDKAMQFTLATVMPQKPDNREWMAGYAAALAQVAETLREAKSKEFPQRTASVQGSRVITS